MSLENAFFYNDSPLVEEQIVFLLKEYKDIKKSYDETIKAIKELDSHIADILEDYYNKGLFDDILDKIFNEWMSTQNQITKTNNPIVKRQWRRMNITGVNDSFNKNECYAYPQGAVAFNYGGNITRYAIIHIKKTRPSTGVENNMIGLYDPTTQNPVGNRVLPIGHGQDITFEYNSQTDKNYLYIAHSSDNSVTPSTSITRVEMTTANTISSSYTTKKFAGVQPYQICFYNGVLYMYSNKTVYIVDWDKGTYKEMCTLYSTQTVNGFLVNRFGIWLSAGESIVLFNMKGKTIFNYNVGLISTDEYRIGEIESLSNDPNSENRIMFFSSEILGTTSGLGQRSLTQCFYFNPVDNDIQLTSRTLERFSGQHATLYVDGSSESDSTNLISSYANSIVNPDGSIDNPFHNCQEAIDYFASLPQQSLEIRLMRTDRTCVINDGMNIYIYPNNVTASGNYITLGGCLVGGGGTLRLNSSSEYGMHIAQTLTQNVGAFQYNLAPCNVVAGTLYAIGNLVFYYEATNYTTCTYSLRSYYATALVSNQVISNKTALVSSVTF